ncbi:hypothetical protein MLD38_008385 [Melastoma candidum]|uniref:Uncharacterized protein n=1 Tax=Melastoma candidum TaxID=119954 RepID=A0ACB9S2N8_9MYRT|nr:hypothetical protein MLD38_008385 [Melastoma candidum]
MRFSSCLFLSSSDSPRSIRLFSSSFVHSTALLLSPDASSSSSSSASPQNYHCPPTGSGGLLCSVLVHWQNHLSTCLHSMSWHIFLELILLHQFPKRTPDFPQHCLEFPGLPYFEIATVRKSSASYSFECQESHNLNQT